VKLTRSKFYNSFTRHAVSLRINKNLTLHKHMWVTQALHREMYYVLWSQQCIHLVASIPNSYIYTYTVTHSHWFLQVNVRYR